MKLRRIAAAFLAVLMVMPLAACGEKEPELIDEEKYSYISFYSGGIRVTSKAEKL